MSLCDPLKPEHFPHGFGKHRGIMEERGLIEVTEQLWIFETLNVVELPLHSSILRFTWFAIRTHFSGIL